MGKEPLTEERIVEIRGREKAATQGPWRAKSEALEADECGNATAEMTCVSTNDKGICILYGRGHDDANTQEDAAFIAHAREDIPALLDEVERLRAENEVLEKALEDLGFFVRTKLDYCPADFIGEGIDEGTDFSCHTEYAPDEASQKCYGDCWADAFRNQAENDIRKFEEWQLRQDMEV